MQHIKIIIALFILVAIAGCSPDSTTTSPTGLVKSTASASGSSQYT